MKRELIYVELKSGYNDNGPAWIGYKNSSKSGSTIYFNGLAFKSLKGSGIAGNYYECESGDEYWISGVKKKGGDRHWAGNGKINIDKKAIEYYLSVTGLKTLPKNLTPVELKSSVPSIDFLENENMPVA
ncbi:MAG: hypothetical protein GWO07_07380 [Candidatus Dadabacteria bacterium]|nr:hypothetical protein [Candidatus Dadabacteria bacterium]